ncbi:hypothetical protein GCM10027049_22700 [Mucilaginibacter puniceus]
MDEQTDLKKKVENWIKSEGLALEYFTAITFMEEEFRTFQSDFVDDNGTPREIDVMAFSDYSIGNTLLRLSCVLECKWSKDKPWIIFTSENAVIAPSACIAQSLGNEVGSALLWQLAGQDSLYETELFSQKVRGFSGRQAFAKDSDLFYNTIQAVINKTVLHLNKYNRQTSNPLDFIVIGFPIIVVDAPLYESYFEDNELKIKEVECSSINWRGSSKWKLNSSVKIVTKNYLPTWVKNLKREFNSLSEVANSDISNLEEVFQKRDIKLLNPKSCSRGIVGLPDFLRKIKESEIGLW